jgi:hypothetical protein
VPPKKREYSLRDFDPARTNSHDAMERLGNLLQAERHWVFAVIGDGDYAIALEARHPIIDSRELIELCSTVATRYLEAFLRLLKSAPT